MYVLELGGDDDAFAACESRVAATGIRPLAPGLALADAVNPDRLRGLAYTHRASELLGHTDASLSSARALLEAAAIDREGSIAVRGTDVHGSSGVSTAAVERELGSVLVDRGFSVDLENPDHVCRVAFSVGDRPSYAAGPASEDGDGLGEHVSVCAVGWLAAESVRDFGSRAPTDKPFFQPGSMDPLLARAVVNMARAGPGRSLLDPMCGTGGVLVEGGLVGADVIGTDAQSKMVAGARTNLAHFLDREGHTATGNVPGDWYVARGDGTSLPLPDGSVDAVVFDAPYGRQSKIERHRLEDLVSGALSEARRVGDRAVVVADRPWTGAALAAGWDLEATFERRVHRSLTRHVLVLTSCSTN